MIIIFIDIINLFIYSSVCRHRSSPSQRGSHGLPHHLLRSVLAGGEHVQVRAEQQLGLVHVEDVRVMEQSVVLLVLILIVGGVHLLESLTLDHLQPLGVVEPGTCKVRMDNILHIKVLC